MASRLRFLWFIHFVLELPGANNDKLCTEWEVVHGSKPPILVGKLAMAGPIDLGGTTTVYGLPLHGLPLQPVEAPGPRGRCSQILDVTHEYEGELNEYEIKRKMVDNRYNELHAPICLKIPDCQIGYTMNLSIRCKEILYH